MEAGERQEGDNGPPNPLLPKIPDHELIRRIGAGAFGEVWLATATSLAGTYRAIKLVHRDSLKGDGFLREFKGIQNFEPISRGHPNLVNILHVGQCSETGHFYYVMELGDDLHAPSPSGAVEGEGPAFDPSTYEARTLQSELRQRGTLPAEGCLTVALSLASALDYLHANSLIHRDVKPANVIFVNGVAKLADIGLVAAVKSAITFVGTEGFSPREGLNTPQADIYSLGKVLYEMVTGLDRSLFPQLPPDWSEHSERKVRLQLNQVVLRACESDPARRYRTAAELYADLSRIQSGRARGSAFVMRFLFVPGIVLIVLTLLGIVLFPPWSAQPGAAMTESERKSGFGELFNGNDLDGWKAPEGNWACVEGTLKRVRSGGDITYEREPLPDNFDLRFDWKVAPGSDSGVLYRPGRIEYQILDNEGSPLGKDAKTQAGALLDFARIQKGRPRPPGRWNESRILCEGDRIRHYLNGEAILDARYNEPEWKAARDRLKAKYDADLNNRGGYLILRDEEGPVWYRRIRLKKLP